MRIRYSEIFFSFQGEAQWAGTPSVWLRFFGCNLNCSGFGQKNPTDPSTYELPYKEFDEKSVTSVNDLPVWKFGCDSSYSWAVKFKHLAHDATVEEVCDRLEEANISVHNPLGLFVHPKTGMPIQLCFTGGEPMLNQKAMIAILRELEARGNCPRMITVETNATKPITDELQDFISTEYIQWHQDNLWGWAMSPKLFNVSGEQDVVNERHICQYALTPGVFPILKFVVNGTEACWDELYGHLTRIHSEFEKHDEDFSKVDIYVMPVGADAEAQDGSKIADLCIEAMNRGFKIATRNHVAVFGNKIGR